MSNLKHTIAVFISDTNPGGTEAYLRSYIPYISRDLFNVYVVATGPELLAEEIGKLGDRFYNIRTGSFPRMQKLVDGKLVRDYWGILLLPIWYLFSVIKLVLLIKREKIELIHSHGVHFNMVAGLACKFSGIPAICHVHAPPKLKNFWSGWFVYGYFGAFLATRFISVSKFAASQFHRSWKNKTEVIPNSIDYNYIKENLKHGELRKMASISQSDFVVGNVSVVQNRKGLERFYELAGLLKSTCCKFILIAGVFDEISRSLLDELKNKYHDLDNVIVIENLKEARLYLCDLDVFFMCSRPGTETFGLVVIEAMACGTPVIAFSNDAMPEIIEHGANGFLVDEGDVGEVANVVSEIIKERIDFNNLGLAAERDALQYFDVDVMCKKLEKIFCTVL